ncbi:uncharacterized protein LOC122863067 isoform X4 [Siniperca chuatsi]|uniref:uncharacterized protein LOC122863067 isoform X4 n=1 Tax=Siniperca chuatsi TaxID=119488 RepID=UPI001CE20E57|nr:uncharacterized protein LOC122863067 isoform X4 [Siniperca chuatsi]
MIKFRWIKMSLFLMPVLQFTAAAAGQLFLSFTVRVGEEVTLSCENVIDGQQKCNSTTWFFSKSRNTAAVELIKLGQIGERAKAKSDRLSVTASCSLLIKKVTVEDVGRYHCQQFKLGDKQGPDSVVLLSVVTITEHKDPDKVALTCSVSTFERCRHTVKWLYASKDVAKDNKDLVTSQSPCSASVSFLTSHFIHTSRSNFLTCEVTDGNKEQLFPFRLQPSGEKPDWWRFSIVSAGLAALIIIVVAVNMWTRTKGKKTQMDENKVSFYNKIMKCFYSWYFTQQTVFVMSVLHSEL